MFEALNSLAIKHAMPARNASIGGGGRDGTAQPRIPPLAHACLSTMHVPPWASSPQASPGRAHSQRCSSDPPLPLPALLRTSFSSACGRQTRSVHHPPSYMLLGIPKASVARSRVSALRLFTLLSCDELVLSPSHPPPGLDVVKTSGTRAPKGKPVGGGGAEPRRVTQPVPPAPLPPRLDFGFPLQRDGGNWRIQLYPCKPTNCPAFSQALGTENELRIYR